jgi:hypothetical protein
MTATKLPVPSFDESVRDEPVTVAELVAEASTERPLTLAEVLRDAGGQAGYLDLDWSTARHDVGNLILEVTRTGHFQRPGVGAAAVVATLAASGPGGRTLLLDVVRPGRTTHELRSFVPEVGTPADLSNTAVMRWFRQEVENLHAHATYLPLLVLVDPSAGEAINADVAATLTELAKATHGCIAVIRDVPEVGRPTGLTPYGES